MRLRERGWRVASVDIEDITETGPFLYGDPNVSRLHQERAIAFPARARRGEGEGDASVSRS